MVFIYKDGSGATWGYSVKDEEGNDVLESDGWDSPEQIKEELDLLKKSITEYIIEV